MRRREDVEAVASPSTEENMISKHKKFASPIPDVAGNGLIDRRALLGRGMLFAGAAATGVGSSSTGAAAAAPPVAPGRRVPAERITPNGTPSNRATNGVRT